MIRHRRFLLVMNVLFVSLFVVASAQAAEEGGSAASEKAAEIFKWINFAIVAGFLLWLCLKKAPAFFSRRAAPRSRNEARESSERGGGTPYSCRARIGRGSCAPPRRYRERCAENRGGGKSGNRSRGTRGTSGVKG